MAKATDKLTQRMETILSSPKPKLTTPKPAPPVLAEPAREESRTKGRSSTYKICEIKTIDGGTLKCVIRNISAEGAMLVGDGTGGVPSSATLNLPDTRETKNFEVMWREEGRVGVRFLN